MPQTTETTDAKELRLQKHRRMLHDLAINDGRELLVDAAATLRKWADDIDGYITQYDQANRSRSLATPETVLSWAANRIACLYPNLRIDLFVDRAAALARTWKNLDE